MPAYYPYLVASLPALSFNGTLPFSAAEFLEKCRGLIPGEDVAWLGKIAAREESIYLAGQPTLKRYLAFDRALRNELVKARAGRKKLEPQKYLRQDGYASPWLSHVAMQALRNPSLLEAEESLDLERWHKLDELEAGHYFDLDYLIIYLFKLLILERWDRIRNSDKARLLEEVIA